MKLSLLAILLTVAVPGWTETLALTVQYHNGEPIEEWDRWTTQYYVDDQGRLTRILREVVESRNGPGRFERIFHWDDSGVRWTSEADSVTSEYAIEFRSKDLLFTWNSRGADGKSRGGIRTIRPLDAENQWESGPYIYQWTRDGGLSRRLVSTGEAASLREITTKGARITFWRGTTESDIFLVSREPKTIVVQYFGDLMPPPRGWSLAGTARGTGTGLWTDDSKVRLATVSLVEDDPEFLLLVPLIFEPHYLK